MTRLVSGRVLKTPSANVSADRYQFIEISEVEPDLGVPPANNYVFTSDPEGNRQWVDLRTTLANENVAFGNVYVADTFFGNGLIVQNIDILDAIIGVTTLANNIVTVTVLADTITANNWNNLYTANVIESPDYLYYSNDRVFSNIQLARVGDLFDVDTANVDFGQALVWNGNAFVPVYVSTDLANIADLAVRVLTLENFTTANIKEASSNLYFTNTRVIDALVGANVILNDLFVAGDLVVQGNSAVLNVATLVVEDKNIILANGATNAAVADGAGITIEGAGANITYRELGDKFELNKNLEVQGNIVAGIGTGGSITGANLITTETVSTDLLITDEIVSNTITNSGYVNFGSQSYIGDEPGAGVPEFRIVAAAGLGLSLENDADISGNNNVATFDISGEFAVPKSLQANSLVSNLLSVTGVAQINGYDIITKELTDATFEPMGHENKANSQISFDANTRTFTIQPVGSSYNVWVKGNKFVKTGAESVILANTTDLYYIYFNTDGNIAVRSSYFDWENDALTSYVYWNANTQSAPFFADERHGITLDWQTHEYLHRTRGAAIAEGFSISNYTLNNDGSSDSNAHISIGNGTFFDEDLQVSIVHSNTPTPNTWEQDLQGPARIPVFYLVGTEWRRDEPTDFALKQGTSRIKYNLLTGGQWTTPDVPSDGYFTTSWIIATNNLNYPILAVMGQTASETIGAEEARTFQDLTLTDFPVIEFRPLYKIIWSTNTGYSNTPKAIISRIYDLRNIVSASPTAAIASDHGLLSGLDDDDHSQYLHIENTRTVTASHTFSGIQSFSNITVSGSLVGNVTGQVSDITNHSVNSLFDVNITGIIPGQILSWNGNTFIPGSADIALFSESTNTAVNSQFANVANTVLSISNFDTDDLTEGSNNLYFNKGRVIESFIPGFGITITPAGEIFSSDSRFSFSVNLNDSICCDVTDTMSNVLTFPVTSDFTIRYILRSIHLTNMSEDLAYISGNFVFDGNTIPLLRNIPIPYGSSLEVLRREQAFKPLDSLELQGFDKDGTPTSNLISATITYESLDEREGLLGSGITMTSGNVNYAAWDSINFYSIIESIKLINLDNKIVRSRISIADSNGSIRSHLAYNLALPPKTTIEILEASKRIPLGGKIISSLTSDANVSVILSLRKGGEVHVTDYPVDVSSGSNVLLTYTTLNLTEGTTLFYTIE